MRTFKYIAKAEKRAAKAQASDHIPADKLAALKSLIEPDNELDKAAEEFEPDF